MENDTNLKKKKKKNPPRWLSNNWLTHNEVDQQMKSVIQGDYWNLVNHGGYHWKAQNLNKKSFRYLQGSPYLYFKTKKPQNFLRNFFKASRSLFSFLSLYSSARFSTKLWRNLCNSFSFRNTGWKQWIYFRRNPPPKVRCQFLALKISSV